MLGLSTVAAATVMAAAATATAVTTVMAATVMAAVLAMEEAAAAVAHRPVAHREAEAVNLGQRLVQALHPAQRAAVSLPGPVDRLAPVAMRRASLSLPKCSAWE